MKNPERVAALLAELRELADNDFERHRLDVLEQDLTAPPTVEVIDDTHQRFNGITYKQSKSGHYMAGHSIHRDVWQYHHGNIPANYEIHHSDENPANNAPDNLQCLTKIEHAKLHNSLNAGRKTETFVCQYCGKTYEAINTGQNRYCSYECMRAGDKINQQKCVKTCAWCGKKFTTRFSAQKFCCHRCQGANMSAQKRITCSCVICGKQFTKTPHEGKKTCSKSCALKLMWQKRRAKNQNLS